MLWVGNTNFYQRIVRLEVPTNSIVPDRDLQGEAGEEGNFKASPSPLGFIERTEWEYNRLWPVFWPFLNCLLEFHAVKEVDTCACSKHYFQAIFGPIFGR